MLAVTLSCTKTTGSNDDESEIVVSVVGDFSYSYFNYRFEDAMKLCTADMRKPIEYIASNITEKDINALRSKETAATCENIDIVSANNSCAEAECNIKNYYRKHAIGTEGKTVESSQYTILLVKEHGKWMVRKVTPLQNGKPNRGRT